MAWEIGEIKSSREKFNQKYKIELVMKLGQLGGSKNDVVGYNSISQLYVGQTWRC